MRKSVDLVLKQRRRGRNAHLHLFSTVFSGVHNPARIGFVGRSGRDQPWRFVSSGRDQPWRFVSSGRDERVFTRNGIEAERSERTAQNTQKRGSFITRIFRRAAETEISERLAGERKHRETLGKTRKKPSWGPRRLFVYWAVRTCSNQTEKLREPDSNRRPRGYEPRELPGCSIPRHHYCSLASQC